MKKNNSDFKRIQSAVATKRALLDSTDINNLFKNLRSSQRLTSAGRFR